MFITKGVEMLEIHELLDGASRIGKGKQGEVYQLSSDRCIKIYNNELHAQMESNSYKLAEGSTLIPKLYEAGPNYLIMELLHGETLQVYLKRKGTITKSDTEQIVWIIHEMIRLGFTRIDAALFHIIVVEGQQSYKIIDLVNCYTKRYRIPMVMFKGLSKLGLLDPFLMHVKALDPELYKVWGSHLIPRSERYGKLQTLHGF
jgi:putative serine/threonine protein kinase